MATETPAPDIEIEDVRPPPDGGLFAWIQCASSFCLFFISWGVVNSFGVFQSYYVTTLPGYSPSQIAWIGSTQASLLIGLGIFVGPLYDYGYLRSLVWVGCFLSVFGMMLTSISNEYWHLLLSQGIVFGSGCGCLFIPSIAALPAYFDKRQSLALGIGASGGALGGIIFPILFQQLQPRIGFGWTTRTIAFTMILVSTIPILGMRMFSRPVEARKIFDTNAWAESPFVLASLFLFLAFMGAYVPLFYIQFYGADTKTVEGTLSLYLVPLLNLGSLFGRIIPTHLADIYGPFNVDIFCVIATGILAFTWIAIRSTPGVVLFSILFGFFAGAVTSLSPNIAVALSPNKGVLGVRLGMLLLPISAGLLIGNPIAGVIEAAGWVSLQVFTGALLITSSIILTIARVLLYGNDWRVRC